MHLFHIPQYTIQNKNVHISVLNGALRDTEQVHCGICEIGLLLGCMRYSVEPFNLPHRQITSTHLPSLIARFMGATWGPSGADRTQVGPMLAPCWPHELCYLGSYENKTLGLIGFKLAFRCQEVFPQMDSALNNLVATSLVEELTLPHRLTSALRMPWQLSSNILIGLLRMQCGKKESSSRLYWS